MTYETEVIFWLLIELRSDVEAVLTLYGRNIQTSVRQCILDNAVSRHIVLIRTNIIHLLNRVPEHDFFVIHRSKCKPMHFEQGYGYG